MLERSHRHHDASRHSATILLLVGGLILLRFAVGMIKLPTLYFQTDEWVSILAATMVVRKGAPILPSGVLYEHGLLFSYIEALVFALGGFHELMARWPSVLFDALTIPLAYRVGREIFRSPRAGVLAAVTVVINPFVLEWGWRARMYGLGQAMSWLLIWSVWLAATQPHKPHYRRLALGVALLSLMTHLSLAVTIAALGVAWLVVSLSDAQIRRAWVTQFRLAKWLPEIGGALLVGGYVLLTWKFGFAAHHGRFEDKLSLGAGRLSASFLWGWLHDEPDAFVYLLLFIPVVAGIVTWVVSYRKSGQTRLSKALVFLYAALATIAIVFIFVLGNYWWRPHYLYMLLLPLLALASTEGLMRLATLLSRQVRQVQLRWVYAGIGLSFFALTMIPSWPALQEAIVTTQRVTYPPGHPYAQAFAYIGQHWQPNDQLMVTRTAICAIYFEHCSLDINHKRIANYEQDGQLMNLYNGAPVLESTADLAMELVKPGHLWLVGDSTGRTGIDEEVVDPSFVQLGRLAMDPVFAPGYTVVYRERDKLLPNYPVHANFADQVEFLGSYLDAAQIRPGNPALIMLFWRPLRPLPNYKVFMHLRDDQNETVGQFDHFPSETVIPLYMPTWKVGQISPDIARLELPASLAPGHYRLLVGLYDPATGARVPVNMDATGEDAVAVVGLNCSQQQACSLEP